MANPPPTVTGDFYADLTAILKYHDDRPLDIEILPSGFSPLLYDPSSNSVGIPKKALVSALIVARTQFFSYLKALATLQPEALTSSEDTSIAAPKLIARRHQEEEEDRVLHATSIILLATAGEHLTACNWRKRRIAHPQQSNKGHRTLLIRSEIRFVSNVLASPLHKHTKSPTLWAHLFWLQKEDLALRHGIVAGKKDASAQANRQDLFDTHGLGRHMRHRFGDAISLALKAGERHPRNYYAFNYARRMLPVCTARRLPGDANEEKEVIAEFAMGELPAVHSWCMAHPRDISGWSFLLWLFEKSWDRWRWNRVKVVDVVRRTVEWASSPSVRWDGESLWVFVQGACSNGFDGDIGICSAIEAQKKIRIKYAERDGWRDFREMVLQFVDERTASSKPSPDP